MNLSTLRFNIALSVNGASVAPWRVRALLLVARILCIPMSRNLE